MLRENLNIEFKQMMSINYEVINSYICGFLNSFGGTIFVGIKDNGVI